MAYTYNIPMSTDQLSVSQGQIQANFSFLGAIAGNGTAVSNAINSSPGLGFNWLYLPPQGAIPPSGSSFPSGNIALYSATNSTTSANELYINKTVNSSGTPSVLQVAATASILSINSNPGTTSSGWTYLPSGVLMQWGVVSAARNTLSTFSFPIPFPTAMFSITATQGIGGMSTGNLNTAPCVDYLSLSQFQVYPRANGTPNSGNVPIYFLAIGN